MGTIQQLGHSIVHMVCNVPVSCKANRVGNQLGAWLYSDLKVV